MKRKPVVILLKLAVGGGLVWYLLASGKIDLSKLGEIRNWGWIVVAQLIILAMLSASFIRWHFLLKAQEIDYDPRETYTLGFIGFFFNQFVPGSTGGDLVKAYYVAVDHPERRVPGIMAVFLDRVMGLLVLTAICGAASLLAGSRVWSDPQLRWFATAVLSALAAALVLGLLFFNDRIRSHPLVARIAGKLPFRDLLFKIQNSVYIYRRHPRTVLVAVALSAGVHLLMAVGTIFCAMAVAPLDVPLSTFFFIVPLASLAMAIPISPGGLGVGELAFIALFEKVGYEHGGVVAVLFRLCYYGWGLVGLIFYLMRRKKIRQAMELGEQVEAAEKEEAARQASEETNDADADRAVDRVSLE